MHVGKLKIEKCKMKKKKGFGKQQSTSEPLICNSYCAPLRRAAHECI